MKKRTKILILFVTAAGLLTACQTNHSNETEERGTHNAIKRDEEASVALSADKKSEPSVSYEVRNKNRDTVQPGMPEKPLDPQAVYAKLSYTPEMFYGCYRIGDETAEKEFKKNAKYMKITGLDGEVNISTLPYAISAGKRSMWYNFDGVSTDGIMRLDFKNPENELRHSIYGEHEIKDNKLIVKVIEDGDYDETGKLVYTLSDITLEYDFEFNGRYLNLSKDGESVTLESGLNAYGEYVRLFAYSYASDLSKTAEGIEHITILHDTKKNESTLYLETPESMISDAVVSIEDSGLFTVTLPTEEGAKVVQYVYFLCGKDGLILTDGDETYYYLDDYTAYYTKKMSGNLSDEALEKIDEYDEDSLKELAEKKENLLHELAKAFEDNGLRVVINEQTGELSMDSTVLFGGDSAELTEDGKCFLEKFINVYCSIAYSDKYVDYIAKTMVEGHIAPIAGVTYEGGLPLSVQRAENVKNYCVACASDCVEKLSEKLETVGYSNSKPIIDANGNTDLAASRRVSFRFIVNID